jgi:DNA repair photolyase
MTTTSNALLRLLTDQGIKVTVLTKGDLTDAIDHLRGIVPQRVQYGITLVSLDEGFRCQWEPGAAPIAQRIEALRLKHEQGHNTFVSIEPFPPPHLCTDNPSTIIKAVPFVDKAILGRWNYAGFNDFDGWYARAASDFNEACRHLGIKRHVKDDIGRGRL